MDKQSLKIAVAGAGLIGCYVGGLLKASGQNVCFIGRTRMGRSLKDAPMELQSMAGNLKSVDPSVIEYSTLYETASEASHVLVCVKSMATGEIAKRLKPHLDRGAVLVSLQNGLDNIDILKTALPDHQTYAGMVAFNIVRPSGNLFAAATEGGIYLENSSETTLLAEALNQAGIETTLHDDMLSVQWSKLLLNLNNALNALSGLPLAEQLRSRRWRLVLGKCVQEGLAVAKAQNITPVRIGKVKPQIIPLLLRLPDFLFERVASQMLKVDPQARSSMAEDLALGRPPEIDHLNGAIVSRSLEVGVSAPVNKKVCDAIAALFDGNLKTPVDPDSL